MRKADFCICKNKDADQLRSNCAADKCLCLRYMDSKIPLLSISEISNKNIIMSSFKSSRDIQKKEGGPDSCLTSL